MSCVNPERLGELAIEALERTAFVVAELADEDFIDDLPEAEWFTRIEYSGPQSGAVFLSGSTGFLLELAASLLGVDVDDVTAESEGLDALREMTNIIGGSVVTAIGGEHCELSLGLPGVVASGDLPGQNPAGCTCIMDAEGERLVVIWSPNTASESMAA